MPSNAVSSNAVSSVLGFLLGKGQFSKTSPNLPQSIVILGEANTGNQAGLVNDVPQLITSALQGATLYGYGSPLHAALRILFPQSGSGVSIPVYAIPQLAAGGAVAKTLFITPTGTATANGAVYLNVIGRETVDGGSYAVNIATGDTPAMVSVKVRAALAGVLACPVTSAAANGIATSVIHSGSAGSGYAANDLFTVNTGSTLATGKVLTVSTGAVATYTILTPGQGYTVASNVATTATSGSGTGFAIDISTLVETGAKCTAKWTGLTSNDINISIDLNNTSTGVTFAVTAGAAGSGTPATANGLASFRNQWRTLVVNTYGLVSTTMVELETENGIPDPVNPTGKYSPTAWRPFIALSGSIVDDPTSITSAGVRPSNVTIAVCPAPLSPGMPYEAAANMAVLCANIFQDAPESDVIGLMYPDMPLPATNVQPLMNGQTFRQTCATSGCSTVELLPTGYRVVDFITTYALQGEFPPFYRWCRDLNIHFNYKFAYALKQRQTVLGKTLVPDDSTAIGKNVIKPKMWAGDVAALNKDFEKRAMFVEADVNNKTIDVEISSENPNRLDTTQSYQISGIGRVLATTSDGGFFFGS